MRDTGSSRSREPENRTRAEKTCAILIPAHNESSGIEETVNAVKKTATNCRILVVADNCSDDTAERARSAGAEVCVRNDADKMGKGYALAFGRDCLSLNPPSVVIVIDADCKLTSGSAHRLKVRVVDTGRPVQGVNLTVAEASASPIVAISNFAMLVKNKIRARGLSRLSGGALLYGTGMAFPWELFEGVELATSNAVEDLDLGLRLALEGVRVDFHDSAYVTSPSASMADSRGQRSRWEHGFLSAAISHGVPLLLFGITRPSRHLLFLGAHMLVPPLALFVLIGAALLLVIAGLGILSGGWLAFFTVSSVFSTALIVLTVVWARAGRQSISFKQLLRVPIYLLWKIPIYLRFFTRRQTGWNRTRRNGDEL